VKRSKQCTSEKRFSGMRDSTKEVMKMSNASLREIMSKAEGGWMRDANCRDMDINLWFPTVGKMPDPFVIEVCNTCSVQTECLDYAIVNVIDDGIWGGRTSNQRKRIRRMKHE